VLEADPQTKMKTEINVVKLFYCYEKRDLHNDIKANIERILFLSENKWTDTDIKVNTK